MDEHLEATVLSGPHRLRAHTPGMEATRRHAERASGLTKDEREELTRLRTQRLSRLSAEAVRSSSRATAPTVLLVQDEPDRTFFELLRELSPDPMT